MIDKNLIRRGDRVLVRDDDGNTKWHEVKYGPWQLGHGEWVLGLKGMVGCYLLERVVEVEQDRPGFLDIGQMLRDKGVEFGATPPAWPEVTGGPESGRRV